MWAAPAQASITGDLVLTIVGCALLVGYEAGFRRGLLFMLLGVLVSPGAVFMLYLLSREQDDPYLIDRRLLHLGGPAGALWANLG